MNKLTEKQKHWIIIGLAFAAFLISFFVKAFYIQFSILLSHPPIFSSAHQTVFIANAVCAAILIATLMLIFQRHAFKALLIADLLLSIVLFADTLYGRYYAIPLSVPIIYQASFMSDVASSTFSLMKWKDIIFFINLPFFIGVLYTFRRYLPRRFTYHVNVSLVLVILLSVLSFQWNSADVDRSRHAYERKSIARDLGVYYFHAYDIYDFAKNRIVAQMGLNHEEQAFVEAFLNTYSSPQSTAPASHDEPNILVIQVEAMQGFVVDLSINGEQVTPFLNTLSQKHLYFDNIYHQVASGNTSDAEFILNTGLYPAPIGAVNYLHPTNTFITLPQLLGEGYSKTAHHGYNADFWNREAVYRNFGYDRFYGKIDFDLDDALGWAISDRSFFKQAMSRTLEHQPFYSLMITLSSHHPYDAFVSFPLNVAPYEGTQLGNYLKSMHYVDEVIEELYHQLQADGLLDNTIVVIYGDHSGLYMDQRGPLEAFLGMGGSYLEWLTIQKIPLWIIEPSGLSGRVSKLGGQIDILPTLLDLVALQHPMLMGESLLKEGSGYALFRDGSVILPEVYFDNGANLFYETHTFTLIEPTATLNEEVSQKRQYLKMSDLILKKDLFNNQWFMNKLVTP